MISRLTITAAAFAVLATATLAFATTAPRVDAPAAAAASTPVVQLERVVITGKRLAA